MMICVLAVCFAIASAFQIVAADLKNPHYMNGRTTMVHLFEWKWNDIADECERFLGPYGFGGVQVSPIQENVKIKSRPWYERYQPISYKFHTRSGTESEFRSMVRRCSDSGVRIYVDVLLNHMSGDHYDATGTGGSKADTFKRNYSAVAFGRDHFHPYCEITNYQDASNVRNCELTGLHDLDQSQEYVREKLVQMMNRAIDIGVAGFRVDAAKHMWPKDLEVIYSRLKNLNVDHGFAPNSRPFIYQEVIDYGGGGEAINKYEYNNLAAVTEFKYGQEISNALLGRNPLKWFVSWGEAWGLLPSKDSLVFIDNHDTQRNGGDNPLTYRSSKLYKMAIAFMLAHPFGTPRVMSSFDFNDYEQGPPADANENTLSPKINSDKACSNGWICEHRWRQIYNMVLFRNYMHNSKNITHWWDNGNNQIAFCRGNRGFIAINADNVDLKERLMVCLPPGTYCDIISGELGDGKCTGKSIIVDGHGKADIEIRTDDYDGVVAFHVYDRLS